jgi:hypothetical protein
LKVAFVAKEEQDMSSDDDAFDTDAAVTTVTTFKK